MPSSLVQPRGARTPTKREDYAMSEIEDYGFEMSITLRLTGSRIYRRSGVAPS